MKLDDLLAGDLGSRPAKDDVLAARVLESLAARPLPPQRRPFFARWWPTALLDADFAPAWPRVGVLASAACLGVMIGLFGLDSGLLQARSNIASAEADAASLVFDAEPLTGVRP